MQPVPEATTAESSLHLAYGAAGFLLILIGALEITTIAAGSGLFEAGIATLHKGIDAFLAGDHFLTARPHHWLSFVFHIIRILHFGEYAVAAYNTLYATAEAIGRAAMNATN